MNIRIKGLRLVICAVLLVALCACSAAQPGDQDGTQPLQQEIFSLEEQVDVLEEELAQYRDGEVYEGENGNGDVDLEYLLNSIIESDAALTSFPVLITGAEVSDAGCILHIDRLEYNPDFTPGGEGEGTYLLNAEAVTEEIDAGFAYVQYDARVESEIGERFAEYVASFDEGAQFTLYMLGDELLLVSEILVP